MAHFIWIMFWAMVGEAGTGFLRAQRSLRSSIVRNENANQAKEAMVQYGLEEEQVREKHYAEAFQRRQATRAKIVTAFGGVVAAAFKNPEFTLIEAIEQAASPCAPSNTVVHVSVDRFTEFEVTYEAHRAIATNEMIQTARTLLPYAKDYLDSLRFSSNGVVIAELDREDIRFVDDWKTAPDKTIAMLLPREIPTRVAQDPSAIERIRDEQRITEAMAGDATLRDRTQQADKVFRHRVEDSVNELRLAVETSRKAVDIQSVRNITQLNQRAKDIAAAKQHAAKAQEFWSAPAKAWDDTLAAQNITGDAREVLAKSFSGFFRNDPAKTAKVFEALNGEIESCQHFISILLDHPDDWIFNSDGIAVKTDFLVRRLEETRKQIHDDALATESALQAWNEAVAP